MGGVGKKLPIREGPKEKERERRKPSSGRRSDFRVGWRLEF